MYTSTENHWLAEDVNGFRYSDGAVRQKKISFRLNYQINMLINKGTGLGLRRNLAGCPVKLYIVFVCLLLNKRQGHLLLTYRPGIIYLFCKEASTGIDCSGFYQEEKPQPLTAAAIIEDFLESSESQHYEKGVRYFFGHRIPD